jgi:effector-binding domain-containing protein
MKKVLRILLIIIVIIVAAFLIMGLIAPKELVVERSIIINGRREVVHEQMTHFRNWQNWIPWPDQEENPATDLKVDYSGVDGQPGSTYHWVGKKTGEGSVTNKSVDGNRMDFSMKFIKPFESNPEGWIITEDAGNGQTKATWAFKSYSGYPMNAMNLVMKGFLENDFDKGLNKLKNLVESGKVKASAPSSAYDIKETQFPATTYAGIRQTVAFKDMEKFFSDSYNKLGKAAGNRISGNPAGIYYSWDEKNMSSDMAAAFPVSGRDRIEGATLIDVPAGKAYMTVHKGGYSGSMMAHEALGKHFAENKLNQGLVVEEYVTGPGTEADSNKWVTNIFYMVK